MNARRLSIGLIAFMCVFALLLTSSSAEARRKKRRKKKRTAKPPSHQIETQLDGTRLFWMHTPNAKRTSLRFVVHTGSEADPSGKSGVAFLVEKAVMSGSYRLRRAAFDKQLAHAHAQVFSSTSSSHLLFGLDSDAEDFAAVSTSFLQMITNPALMWTNLERERNMVLIAPPDDKHDGRMRAAGSFLAPSGDGTVGGRGDQRSRQGIEADQLADFARRYFRPANISVVVTGPLSWEDAKKIVAAGVLLPPSTPDEKLQSPSSPTLPIDTEAFGYPTAMMMGYAVSKRHVDQCRPLAALLDYRLRKRLQFDKPIAWDLHTGCHVFRGQTFLYADVAAASTDVSRLEAALKSAYRSLRKKKPTAKEKERVNQRGEHGFRWLRASSEALADALVENVVLTADSQKALLRLNKPVSINAKKVFAAARSSIDGKRRFVVRYKPSN